MEKNKIKNRRTVKRSDRKNRTRRSLRESNEYIYNMKIKNGFELRDVCGEHIIIAHGVENIDFTKVITLNESAAFIWNQVEGKTFTEDEVVRMLLDEYDVEEAQARADVKQLLASWEKAGLVEI